MDTPQFIRRDANHVVIQRVGNDRWVEQARFAEITDAADYAVWRRSHHGAIGVETMIVIETDAGIDVAIPPDRDAPRRPIDDPDTSDQRTAAWPRFDA